MTKHPYIPPKLPPALDNLYTPAFVKILGEANRALAKLGELSRILPTNIDLLAAPLLRKEAVLSSKIEGTQTTLSELFKYEAKLEDKNVNKADAKEVENYVKALHRGMEDVRKFSLSTRTITAMHETLLSGVRNEQGIPGKYRDFQKYIAKRGFIPEQVREHATYVPPPPQEVQRLMGELENYINSKESDEDPIIKCALIHYQFEAIHPFGDGNGRIGRLLIPLFFYEREIIRYPLLYISEFFENNLQDYYGLLKDVTENGAWVEWIRFFVEAIKTQSEKTYRRGEAIMALHKEYQEKIRKEGQSANAVALIDHIFRFPYTAAPLVATRLRVSHQTAMRLLEQFARLGMLDIKQGRIKRPKFSRPVRLFVFRKLIDIIN
jgi:Fic family protein